MLAQCYLCFVCRSVPYPSTLAHALQISPAVETALWRDDIRVLRWLADTRDVLEARALVLRKESIAEQVLHLGMEDPSAVVAGVVGMLHRLAPDRREAVIAALRREVLFGAHAGLPPLAQPQLFPTAPMGSTHALGGISMPTQLRRYSSSSPNTSPSPFEAGMPRF